jgi:hypothetical protein
MARLFRIALTALALAVVASCVPADGALPTGSAEFTIFSKDEDQFIRADRFADRSRRWDLRIDRLIASFKTITIGEVGVPERCSYRGRGARGNVIFDLARGNIQTFNGIQPGDCPDVGIVFGLPDLGTTLGAGMTIDDIGAMLVSPSSHFILEASATPAPRPNDDPTLPYRIFLRFDTARTTTTYGGCRDTKRGVRILPEAREHSDMIFRAEALFREIISPGGNLRLEPFAAADDDANGDHVITMEELDRQSLATTRRVAGVGDSSYVLPDGVLSGSLGDFVRAQLRFVFQFNDGGVCNGNPPGVE